MKDLLAPGLPSSNSFMDLKDALKSNFIPKPSVITQRFKFHHRIQQPSESITVFSTPLCLLAMDCNFEAVLEHFQFICGLHSEAMHKRLLTEDNITLKREVEIAIGTGIVQKCARQKIHQVRLCQPCKHCG